MDKDPPLQHVCPTRVDLAKYGFGDASKVGFEGDFFMPRIVGVVKSEVIVGVYIWHGL